MLRLSVTVCSMHAWQLARVRGGLMPMSYPVNPERECKTDGFQGFQNARR